MPIPINTLESAAQRYYFSKRASDLIEAKASAQQTAFLSHSGSDKILARGVQVYLQEMGWNVYIYWQDSEMPEPPTRANAENVQRKIKETDWFLFLATSNSMKSRWCPWEIGYADGVKPYDNIMIIPTTDYSGRWHGNEYLQLYRQITHSDVGGLLSLKPRETRGTRVEMMSPGGVIW